MSTIKVNKIENTATADGGIAIDASGHVQVDGVQLPTAGQLSNRNVIINGAMSVAQRGTSDTSVSGQERFVTDRFLTGIIGTNSAVFAITQSTDAPTGFTHSLKWDCTTADSSLAADHQSKIEHRIEGLNVAHLGWGTANAQTVTLSFYIKSNLTGNTQVAFVNSDNNRSYVATFTIDAANTWERKVLTIPGDTSGTWLTDNTIGLRLRWGNFGSDYQTGSVDQWNGGQYMSRNDSPINFSSSTSDELYLTGVQLEVGEKATPFEHKRFSEELNDCLRYYEKSYNYSTAPGTGSDTGKMAHRKSSVDSGITDFTVSFSVRKRDNPTLTVYSPDTGTASRIYDETDDTDHAASGEDIGETGGHITCSSAIGGNKYLSMHYDADAEL